MLRSAIALNASLAALLLAAGPAAAQPGEAVPPGTAQAPAVDTTAGARLSGVVPMNESYGGADILTGLTVFGLFEVGSRFAGSGEIGFLFNGSSDGTEMEPEVFAFHLDIGGRGFLNEHPMAGMFVGGGFGMRWMHVDRGVEKDKGGGVGAFATAGVLFFRHSPVRLIADVRYDANLFKLDELTGNQRGHGVQFGLGLSFRGLVGKSLLSP